MESEARSSRPEGLFGSIRGVLASATEVLETRLEILSTEIGEERFNLTRMIVVALAALGCFQIGVFLAVLFVVLLVGEGHRLLAIGVAALVLLVAAAIAVWWLRRWLHTRPPLFATTMAELRKDRERLRGDA